MTRLAGKAAFVTGAGGAIGGAIARRFASEGAAVVCADVNSAAAERTASAIVAAGGRSIALHCDVSRSDEVKKAMSAAAKAFPRINVLVNTAAADEPSGNSTELDESEWNRALAVNLTGVFLVCKYGIPKLIESGGGSIVIVASQLGQVVVPRRPAYVTSKAALIQLPFRHDGSGAHGAGSAAPNRASRTARRDCKRRPVLSQRRIVIYDRR
jgi:NAD(P)-dependent dehydrogenase (short-subunit alcohol dehydrogenase family)